MSQPRLHPSETHWHCREGSVSITDPSFPAFSKFLKSWFFANFLGFGFLFRFLIASDVTFRTLLLLPPASSRANSCRTRLLHLDGIALVQGFGGIVRGSVLLAARWFFDSWLVSGTGTEARSLLGCEAVSPGGSQEQGHADAAEGR